MAFDWYLRRSYTFLLLALVLLFILHPLLRGYVTGQFYIAVVMAELIGLKVSRPGNGPRAGTE
jgi:hypothetical protein